MPAVLVLPDFDDCRLTDLARKILNERQLAIWTRTHRDGWTASRLAQELGICRATVENDLRAARKRLKEAIEQAGEESKPFRVTVERDSTAESLPDSTPAEVARRMERAEKREGRIRME